MGFFIPNGSWSLGLGFGVAAKKNETEGKLEFLLGVSYRSLNLMGQNSPMREFGTFGGDFSSPERNCGAGEL